MSLDPEVEERLNGDVEKIKSLDEYVKEGVLSDIKTTYQKLISLEQKIATKEKVIKLVLQDNTELRYWLREFETYEEIDKKLKPQYRSEMAKNTKWKEGLEQRGYNQKQIDDFDQRLNNKIKEITEKYQKNYTFLIKAKDQLRGIDAYTPVHAYVHACKSHGRYHARPTSALPTSPKSRRRLRCALEAGGP